MCSIRSRTVRPVSQPKRIPVLPAEPSAAAPDPAEEQLSRKVQRNLSISDDVPPPDMTEGRGEGGDGRSRERRKGNEAEEGTTSEEVGELAGYFGELYLPRASVSVDAALMVELMYT